MKIWEINRTVYKVSDFISWQRNGSLLLNPSFQRRSVWKKGAKSYLLDTIIRGLPIPIIFLRERRSDVLKLEPVREVVDGQQRLRTLIAFVAPSLLKNLDPDKDNFTLTKTHNEEFANKKFDLLPKDIKEAILDYQFSVQILPASTDDREVLQIFGRMNSTGLKLNNQELRNAEFFGEFKTSVYNTALKHLSYWRKWKIFTDDNIARMAEVELSSELYILMLSGITGKSPKNIDGYYKNYDSAFEKRDIVESRFEIVMKEIDEKFGDFIGASVFQKSTLFYPLFAIVYDINFGLKSGLKKKSPNKLSIAQINKIKQINQNILNENVPKNIIEATSTRRATDISQRQSLFKYFYNKLK